MALRIWLIFWFGKITDPGWSTFMPSTRYRMPTSRSVAIRVEPSSESATSFTLCKIGFGLRAGTTPPTIPNAASSPSRLHRAFMRAIPLGAMETERRNRPADGQSLSLPPHPVLDMDPV